MPGELDLVRARNLAHGDRVVGSGDVLRVNNHTPGETWVLYAGKSWTLYDPQEWLYVDRDGADFRLRHER